MEKKNSYLIVLGIGIVLLIVGIILVSIHTQFGWQGLIMSIYGGFFILAGICCSIVGLVLYLTRSKKPKSKPIFHKPQNYCPECGKPISQDSKYCIECGKELQ